MASLHRAKVALLLFAMTSTLLGAAEAQQVDIASDPPQAGRTAAAAQGPAPAQTPAPALTPAPASAPTPALTPAPAPTPTLTPALTPAVPPLGPVPAAAPVALRAPAVPVDPNEIRITGIGGKGSTQWTIVVLLTFLTLIPSLLLCMTPFARLLVVFHFLRQALGLQTTPSNQTLIGLALVLTFFLMQPVGETIYQTSVMPLQQGHISAMQALERGAVPVRQFMLHYVREKDVALFVELSKEPRPRDPNDLSLRVIAPAYILSELRMGFQIGTVLFLPFLVIDMVVASISTSVGMLQLPPVVISTPLKLLLFVMVDGWNLLIGSLMRSFN
jgi:flagellar biosynthetic protein FliP